MKIEVKNPQRGIGQSALVGLQELRCLNISDYPGSCRPNPALINDTDAVVDDIIEDTALNGSKMFAYTRDNDDDVYLRNGGTWSLLSGYDAGTIRGIAFWKGCLLVLHTDLGFDSNDNNGATVDWDNAFYTGILGSASTKIKTIIIDDVLYFGFTRNNSGVITTEIYAMEEVGAFDSTDSGTYTVTLQLTLPSDLEITCLAELNGNMLIGTKPRTAPDLASSYLFLWDTISADPSEKIFVEETGVNCLVTTNNLAYFQAGREGEWYVTNGTTVNFINKLPSDYFPDGDYGSTSVSNCTIFRNKIYFDVSDNSASRSLGVYSLDLRTGAINYEHIISTKETGENDGVVITSITNLQGSTLVVTWWDVENSSYGADHFDLRNTVYTSGEAYLVSEFFQIAGDLDIAATGRFDLHLTKPLVAGDDVKVYYRDKYNIDVSVSGGGWTEIVGLRMTTGDQNRSIANETIPQVNSLQFLILLDGTADFISLTCTI